MLLGLLALAFPAAGRAQAFDHLKHAKLFPTCTVCHAGIETAGGPVWPDSASCATCHDGTVQKRITWQVPESLRTNLRFDHARHRQYALARPVAAGDTARAPVCMDCHGEAGAPWMAVRPPVVGRCFACHGIQTAHFAAPDSACATCHLPLASATALRRADVAALDTPPSHHLPGFATAAGHGTLAKAPGGGVAASCATCHARDFCLTCHVDAPEQPVIQALARDPRATAIPAHLSPPPSHAAADFLVRHGRRLRQEVRQCSTCHTQESCLACHRGTARVAAALPAGSSERGAGAVITRRPPPSHTAGFETHHAAEASAAANSCAGCHVRADCLECHRPTAASATGYHPTGWLARHPAAAYARASNCSDCHNTGSFCVSCHAQAGLRSGGLLVGSGYHDAKRFFGLGHGQAARQSLETCVGCHVERDCLTCHASFGGRRFNPHGPGFDAARLKRKNPQMCTACHGTNIPG
jgi:Doubled CXXCH motif (Paired_CXXCH_1)